MSRKLLVPLLVILIGLSGVATAAQTQMDEDFKAVDKALAKKNLNKIPPYVDARSTPEAVIWSFYNAINRGEFSRAYGYYLPSSRPPFASWVRGYQNTRKIQLRFSRAEPDFGAGQRYWRLPVAIEAESYKGKKTVFGGCYEFYQAAPLNQEAPPFESIAIVKGSLKRSSKPLNESLPASCM
jgi:hypothetical protein